MSTPRRGAAQPPPARRTAESEARRVRTITRTILVVGFTAAAVLFFIDLARPDNPLGYNPLETKKYVHDLELYGGKANVMAAEFREWFAGLWYGRNLAYTTAVISVLLTGVVRLAYALREPPEEPVPGAPSPSPNRPGAAWPPDALPRSGKRDAFRPGRSDPSTPPGLER